ncbi:glycosyl hydrolase family 8 [Cytophagaceae bacterium ABcell3]|nr:glycosyl hydrolase family 8 [Cytophagaceae bacterium ABcell3]
MLYNGVVKAQINTPAGAVVPFGANQGYAFGIMPNNLPSGGPFGRSQHAAEAYNEWKQHYVAACPNGRFRVKFDDPNRVVSEGIAYGMLLAVYAADKPLFDGLWHYYKDNSNGNGVMNWLIEGCNTVRGFNGATDAEFDAAMALLLAQNQWPNATQPFNYGHEASQLIDAIWRTEMDHQRFQAKNGDAWGWSSCRNPSYQSPAYYREYASHMPALAANWNNSIDGAYTMLNRNAHPITGLVSDWCNEEGVMNTCNGGYMGYGYDACRFPFRMAQDVIWNNEPRAKNLLEKMTNYCKSQGAGNLRGPRNLDGSGAGAHNATFVSTYALAAMGTDASNQAFMNSMYNEVRFTKDPINNFQPSGYFGNTLRVMSLFMMTGNFWKMGTTSFQDINVRVGTTDIPSQTEYDFQNVIQSGNKEITFTIENKGAETLLLNGTPRVAISGEDAANFTINQSAVPASLGRNQSATFTITFSPNSTTGTRTALVTIANNDPDDHENPYTFTVTGTGTLTATAPRIAVFAAGNSIARNSTFAMGTGATASPNSHRFEIRNTGDAPLNIADIVGSTGFAVQVPIPTTVGIGESEYFWVTATSTTAANTTGSFTITSDDASNPAFRVNLSASFVACGQAITANEVFQDFDANTANSTLDYANPAWTTVANPYVDDKNQSYRVASFVRPATGDYNGVRYRLCGTNSISLSSEKHIISMLVYSPVAGTPVLMNLKTAADVADTDTYPATSSVTVNTTKTNQWERLYFDHSAALGVAGVRFIEVFIDPLASQGTQTYYVDEIKLDVAPCLADIPASGVLQDYDNHRNMSLPWAPPGTFNEVFANPFVDDKNPSATVAHYVRPVGEFQIIRYATCGAYLDLEEKAYISMLIYSTRAGVPVTMSLKNSATAEEPLEVAAFTAMTTKAGAWERLYFDFSAIQGNTSVRAIDIFIDPDGNNTGTTASRTYYIDDIRYEEGLPCVTQIQATRILNDFDSNRYVTLAFSPTGSYNEFATNTVLTGNSSAGCASYVRPAAATADVIRYAACGDYFDLSLGRTVLSLQVLSPNPETEVILSLKKDDGETEVAQAYARMTRTNVWETLNFDFTDAINSQEAAFIDIIIDPNGTHTATLAQRSYRIDNLIYSVEPEINVRRGIENILTGSTIAFENIATGESSEEVTLTIVNNGVEDLILSGDPKISITGNDADHFTINQELVTSPVTLGRATSFTITFTPISSGLKTASIEIENNDSDENPYYINLEGIGIAPEINLAVGSESISPSETYDFGDQEMETSSEAVTFTIGNSGLATLHLTGTPLISVTGDAAEDFIVSQESTTATLSEGESTAFSVIFAPSAPGLRSAEISIESNDLENSPFIITLSGNGIALNPEIMVRQGNNPILSEGAYAFANALVGHEGTDVVFAIANDGNAILHLLGTPVISIGGVNADDFTINQSDTESEIAAGGFTTFSVSFNPTEAGERVAIITIENNTEESPYTFTVTGTGVTEELPEISVQVGSTAISSDGAYAFADRLEGTSSAPILFTVFNRGTAPLTLDGDPLVLISGDHATDFIVNTTTTASTVEGGQNTTFSVVFTPSGVGIREAVLTISNNDNENNPYIINLSGIGVAPVAVISANIAHTEVSNVGNVTVGSTGTPVVYTITNTGTGTLNLVGTPAVAVSGLHADEFTVNLSATNTSLSPEESTTFTVVFSPAAEGTRSAVLTIASNDPETTEYVINLTGNGTIEPTPSISLNIASGGLSSFGSVPSGSDSDLVTYTISNTGSAVLRNISVSITGTDATDFIVVQNPAVSVAVGGSTTFSVVFRPSSEGEKEATMTIGSNDPEQPEYTINLAGTATAPLTGSISLDVPSGSTSSYGEVSVGSESQVISYTITNNGLAPLNISSVSIDGTNAGDFIIVSEPASPLAIGSTTTISVVFSPTAEGTRTASLNIVSSDSELETYTINLTGTATASTTLAPIIRLNVVAGSTQPFGNVEVGTQSEPITFTVSNIGTAPLTISGVTISGAMSANFVVLTEPTSTISAGGSSTFTVAFTPSAIGTRTATLVVASNDQERPSYSITLSGNGTSPGQTPPNGSISLDVANGEFSDFGVVANGQTAQVTYTITNNGTTPLTLTGNPLVQIGRWNAEYFEVVEYPNAIIPVGGSTSFTVAYVPTSTISGSHVAELTIVSDDPNVGTYTIILTGASTVTSISPEALASEIYFYPNPVQEIVFVSTGSISNINEVVVRNSLGIIVFHDVNHITSGYGFNVSKLASGVYFVEVKSQEGISVIKKLVKQ